MSCPMQVWGCPRAHVQKLFTTVRVFAPAFTTDALKTLSEPFTIELVGQITNDDEWISLLLAAYSSICLGLCCEVFMPVR